jgi:hypothetical protein
MIEISPKEYEKKLNWYDATLYCQLLTIDNKNDWRMPTKDELNVMYTNKDVIGGFVDYYWCSTPVEGDLSSNWGQNFKTGKQGEWGIARSKAGVRIVRVPKI